MGKRDLGDAYEISYNSRGSGGKGACDWSRHSGGVKFYKPKEGVNKINIIPYEIRDELHPLVKAGKRKVGDLSYVMDVWVHQRVGPGEAAVVCPSKNYGKACPLCEAQDACYKKGDEEGAKAFKASRRVYYNIEDVVDPDEGVQVFDVSHFMFEKELIGAAKRKGEEGAIVRFADPDVKIGKVIKCYGEKEKSGGFEVMKFKDFEFVDRKVDSVDGLIDDAISFDSLLTLHNYDEIVEIMTGVDSEEAKPKKSHQDDEDTVPKSRKKTPEPEEEDRPKKHHLEADDGPSCPVKGGVFGKDNDNYEECENCNLWKACARAGR
jgi:hypothetical protein